MNPDILLLGSLYDFAVDIVAHALADQEASYLRLNREQFSDLRLTLDPIQSRMRIHGTEFETEIGPDLKAVLYRAPVFLRNSPGASLSPEEQLARSQWGAFLRSLTVFDKARWMNHPASTYQAECKPYQLKIARECGFSVPDTIATNDVDSIRARFSAKVAVKSIDTVYLRDGEDALFAYTSILSVNELSEENTSQVPLFAQQVIEDKVDLRVTVVGKSLWAYRITVDGQGVFGDWRLRKREEITYEPIDLPADIKNMCLLLCQRLQLPFAGIDLMQTSSSFFFVEVNPTGEWAWLPGAEDSAGVEIATWLVNQNGLEAGP